MSVAASTRNSPASSRSSSWMSFMCSRYCSSTREIGMSWMSISSVRMSQRRRSMGPAKFSSWTRYSTSVPSPAADHVGHVEDLLLDHVLRLLEPVGEARSDGVDVPLEVSRDPEEPDREDQD